MRHHHDNTLHAIKRTDERMGVRDNEQANRLIAEARNNGKLWYELPPGPTADFVKRKSDKQGKIVKYYKGWIYVFFKTSKRCITMYDSAVKLPEDSNNKPSSSDGYSDPALKSVS
jgi:hypothetical protein